MVDFNDPKNVTNRMINIDDVSAVISFLLIEIYADFGGTSAEASEKLISLANRLSEASENIRIENRAAVLSAVSTYLIATEPSGV